MKFLSPSAAVTPAGMFSAAHFIYLAVTFAAVIIALCLFSKADRATCKKAIISVAIILTVIEAVKIAFVLCVEPEPNPNSYIPLYFCSIEIYASLLAAFAKGRARRVGEVFMMTGGIIGGVFFTVYPLTSLSIYPAFHLITLQSYIFHGLMTFIGFLMLIRGYRILRFRDLVYHVIAVGSVSAVGLVFNLTIGTNMMFLSQNYPGTFIEPIYNALPRPLFTLLAMAIQATGPFCFVFGIYKLFTRKKK